MRKVAKLVSYLMIALLAACGGDTGFVGTDTPNSGTTGGGAVTGTGASVQLGNGVGSAFVGSVIGIPQATLSAGGRVTLTVTLQDDTGALYAEPVSVNFSSGCIAQNLATIDTPVTTSTGIATSDYIAQGCSGSDTITATVALSGSTLTASGTLTVAASALGSIQFVSATPSLIALRGTGGSNLSETATVVFKVINETGGPAANQTVNFSLNTNIGGITLEPASGISGANGTVSTTVQSGTVSTPVRVTASIDLTGGGTITTQSDQLVVSTGLPDQDSFSISATTLNPEGWDHDGTQVVVTARVADRFNNPVPDGTAVSFTTEGGSIGSSCVTIAGTCSVNWISQNPRPCGQASGQARVGLVPSSGPNICSTTAGVGAPNVDLTFDRHNMAAAPFGEVGLGQPYAGRATITATVVGEESFFDANGNGVFDGTDTYTDLPEVWRDDNEDGVRDAATEVFMDFNNNGLYDAADTEFNGVLCVGTASVGCSTVTTVHVRRSLFLVMSGSTAYTCIRPSGAGCGDTISVSNGGVTNVAVHISDVNNQPVASGSIVTVSCTKGTATIGGGSYTVPSTNTNGPISLSFTYEGSKTTGGSSGSCTVSVKSPKGLTTSTTVDFLESA